MLRIVALSITLLVVSASGGCGSDNGNQDDVRTEAEKQQALRDSAFGPMTETLDRAKGVEKLQQDRMDDLGAAIENSEDQ